MKRRLPWSLAAMGLLLSSCAGLETSREPLDQLDKRDFYSHSHNRGFRYYQPAIYILVYPNNMGGIITKTLVLPDRTKIMSSHPYSFIATNKTELTFTHGMLSDSSVNADATALPAALLEAATTVASAALKAGVVDAQQATGPQILAVPGPYLFKLIRKKDGTVVLVGDGGNELYVGVTSATPATGKNPQDEKTNEGKP